MHDEGISPMHRKALGGPDDLGFCGSPVSEIAYFLRSTGREKAARGAGKGGKTDKRSESQQKDPFHMYKV
jgi:hypothetical protein